MLVRHILTHHLKRKIFLHQFGAVTHQYLAYVPYKQPNQVQASPADDPKP